MTIAPLPAAPAAALTLLLACAGTALADAPTPIGGIRRLAGSAHATDDGHLMYRESHWLFGDATVEGRPARQYRLGLASWIGFVLPHIDVAYDARSRTLLRFVGIANIHGSDGDNVRARIVFDPAKERMATPAELAQARQAPLDGRCPIP
ncbi:hypothetical protein ACO2Q2_02955 [Dyella sp. KRB-257]|uniref:hypothetical protein n=1 Tax=Dyella sp. KRB-257 TaxID=3400915 RepID=UPI003C0E1157